MMSVSARPQRPTVALTYAWGYNNYAGLGLGHTARVHSPTRASLPAGTIDVQGGTDFSVALTRAGKVYTWGGNRWGQLGDGTTRTRFAPKQVALRGRPHIVAIAAGDDHVIVLTKTGRVYGWGRNDRGQVGAGPLADRCPKPLPVQVPGAGRIKRIAAGNACSLAIRTSGALYGWGHATPLGHAVGPHRLAKTRGGVDTVGQPVRLSLPRGVEAEEVDAGRRHLVVVTRRGKLLTFGVNPVGRPMPTTLPAHHSWGRIDAVSAGDDHTLALTTRGVVLTWGSNRSGQLGTGDDGNRDHPVAIALPHGCGRVKQVSASGASSYMRAGHRVYSWGQAAWGAQGRGVTEDTPKPRAVDLPDHLKVVGLHGGRHHRFAFLQSDAS